MSSTTFADRVSAAIAQLSDRYATVLPGEAVAEVVQAACDAVLDGRPVPGDDSGALVEQVVARAKADLALAAGAPVAAYPHTPAGGLATAWTTVLDGLVVVRAVGEFDLDSQAILRAELGRAMDTGRPAILVDLGRVSFMDPAGLAPLIIAARAAGAAGRRVLLVQVPAQVDRLIGAVGVAGEFAVPPRTSTGRAG